MVEADNPDKKRKVPGHEISQSKTLSWLLRHNAESQGLTLRPDGYCKVDEVLNVPKIKKLKIDVAQLKYLVESNDKKRYEMMEEEGVFYIRATQGHTMKAVETEALLTKIQDPFEFCEVIHGTYFEPLPLIMGSGLNKMARNHVHLAIGKPGKSGVISGMR